MIRLTATLLVVLTSGLFSYGASAANISGKINFKGTPPPRQMIDMGGDRSCAKMHDGKPVPSEITVINPNNTLKNVFIYVKNGLPGGKTYPKPNDHVTLDQQGCMYSPHVVGMRTGQQLDIVNSDQVIHNVHALPKNNTQFNIAQPKKGKKDSRTFDKPEIMVKIKCDVHPWMAAWVGVLDHPFFAVSDDKGNFEIKDLPPGEYDLEAWHEKLGTQTLHIKVGKSDARNADFTYAGK